MNKKEAFFKARRMGAGKDVASDLPPRKWEGTLTNSSRTTFLNCRKKFDWQYLRRLSPRTPYLPFFVGGLFHNGLERMYTSGKFDEDNEREIVEEACDKACKTPGITTQMSDTLQSQSAMIMGMLIGYEQLYLKKDLRAWKVLSAESTFKYPLKGELTKISTGKRDMVVQEKATDKVALVEHKTTSWLTPGYISKLPLDSQILKYALSILKQTGKAPDKVVYNVARKAALRKKQTESLAQFCRRIEDEYTANPTSYFYRETLTFSMDDLRRYEAEENRFVGELDRAIKEGYFSLNTSHCTAYGTCHYMPLCVGGADKMTLTRYRVRKAVHEELVEEVDG